MSSCCAISVDPTELVVLLPMFELERDSTVTRLHSSVVTCRLAVPSTGSALANVQAREDSTVTCHLVLSVDLLELVALLRMLESEEDSTVIIIMSA
jgi:hypothetical protein